VFGSRAPPCHVWPLSVRGTAELDDTRALDGATRFLSATVSSARGIIYLDGQLDRRRWPKATALRQREVVEREWGTSLIRSWNEHGWIDAPARIGASIAPLIGARPDEVIVADSTSVNIFKLLTAAAALQPERRVILSEAGNFHTDLHVASGAAELTGMELRVVERGELEAAIGPEVGLVLLTHVHYKAGFRFDMAALNARAEAAGARVVWDLSHSVGAVPLKLNEHGAELAIGCGYKYLNGGPGRAGLPLRCEHLQEELVPLLRGWMGHAAPSPLPTIMCPRRHRRFLAGTRRC
jgi:kynureninase